MSSVFTLQIIHFPRYGIVVGNLDTNNVCPLKNSIFLRLINKHQYIQLVSLLILQTIPTTAIDYRSLADLLVDTAVQEPKLRERRIMYQVASECYASSFALNNSSDLLLSWGYLYQDLVHAIQRKSHFPYLANLHDSPSEFDFKE